ncbi:precorrin-6Y C5,15-methyltransferase [Gordonia araii NBRC 100433]|uniref:Precorrin-6Y C5,15-methyltransferase n=1 Tax=Gordonia araii NBRC 100433 TaxID=1073574 RepID=G7H7R4_9ACTN|nr:bifunctional cobalt-precorrin-7 (C(5))-methyltransferase/cobalt-precorrin-6B (C(15))-methyltransferase [Gordonia araii]NNG95669.1 bifunctional cobalt-precorrin-7 (C(5))-methyltransferase/cobalt-precorrin-6B (C(15))-methyltransferase [Gordonia araii NBRC 100433]GAB11889.1 precorrin-6Y C5,15-methyltransferase [Gordonia araii NBRC 100433]
MTGQDNRTSQAPDTPRFVVVGIGADGWDGLSTVARRELRGASRIFGSARQLALLGEDIEARQTAWRSPMSAHLHELIADPGDTPVHLLASGDPMFHGLGSTVVAAIGAEHVRIVSHPSSTSLAAARLGWDLSGVRIVSLVTGDVDDVLAVAGDGRRLFVLSRDASSPAKVAETLRSGGWGASTMTVLEQLGGPAERMIVGRAGDWEAAAGDALNLVAVECAGPARVLAPGLADDDFAHDGQLTKQTVRALTISALRPADGQVLWDVGAGSGSVGIEWLRLNPTGEVTAFERDAVRARRIEENARRHGVASRLTVVDGDAAATIAAHAGLAPDSVFVGGGLTADLFALVWSSARVGTTVVVNAVGIPTQQLLVELAGRHGGTLRRFTVETAGPLGSVTAWRPALPIVQWTVGKEEVP